ncbi:hypothetical protein Moror_17129 [Moniliophthora roreri MCA 2997]|uniref:DUF6534 domain-containing protein n=2 Tax=Moniliophthora roreri TaxID=221103 RepID=V2X8K3_MONRO|nr:hypothetical protein Moror_17129 [Moniliophthora roreri MCA 2997]
MTQRLDLDDTFGAMYIGAMISMGLYGITTLQTFFYFRNYERDDLEVKALVIGVWILDTLHVVFMCHAMHYYLIVRYGMPQTLLTGIWSLYASLLTNIITAFISQTFFTKRIHYLCPRPFKWFLTTATGLIVLAHFVFGIATVVYFYLLKDFSRLKEADHVAVVPFGVTAVVSDIVVAAALVMLLDRSRTEFEETNSLINKLIVLAINRCVLTSVVAIIEVILFLTIRNSLYAFAIDFIIGKLYANSLLAHLNSRRSLSKRGSSRRTFTGTSFDVAAPNVISLSIVGSSTNPESSGRGAPSIDHSGLEENSSHRTGLLAADKRHRRPISEPLES